MARPRLPNEREPLRQISVCWDRDYGINDRTGWTVVVDGIVEVELEPSLFRALYLGFIAWRHRHDWLTEETKQDGSATTTR